MATASGPDFRRELLLSPLERGAWLGFVQSYGALCRRLDDELRLRHDLPLASFEVLAQLEQEPGQRLRMVELGDRVALTRSGITRLVDRLEREGLVRRIHAEHDARCVLVELTEAGLAVFGAAAETQMQGLRRFFFEKLAVGELEGLNAILDRVGPDSARARERRLRLTRD